jgi:hypothetical protein
MAEEDLTDFDWKLFEYIKAGDYETEAWSSPKAAENLGVKEKEIYESLAKLSKSLKGRIYIYYRNGALRIQTE